VTEFHHRYSSQRRQVLIDLIARGIQEGSSAGGLRGLRVAREAVIGNLLPHGRVGDVLARCRPDLRWGVEGTEAYAHLILGGTAEQRRAAVAAEPLRGATLGLPGPEAVLPLDDAE
jgi:hypothetical protein